MEIKNRYIWTGIIICVVAAIIFVNEKRDVPIISGCIDRDDSYLPSAVSCMVSDVKPLYKYNHTQDAISLSDQQLFQQGGDCKDWSEYYIRHLKSLGFEAESKVIFNDKENFEGHQFVIAYSRSAYCIIDQLDYDCRLLA